jgi:asparagine synthase (glutamine-hydrolysing)
MSAICGHWSNSAPEDYLSIIKMTDKLNHWGADKVTHWRKKAVALGHLMLLNTPESHSEELPYFHSESGLCITADLRLDNRSHLLSQLDGVDKNSADSQFILKAYQKWGVDCPKHLLGDFAFAIWDEGEQRLFCARDHVGIKPLYYYFKDGCFAFSSEIKGILALGNIDQTLDELWIADFLIRRHVDRSNTMYQHIQRLDGAHSLIFQNGEIQIQKYWEFNTQAEIKLSNEAEYIEAFNDKLDVAVKRRLRTSYGIAAELSGGLDSSTVVHHLHKQIGSNFHAFSLTPFSKDFDFMSERGYIEPFSQAKGFNVNFLDGTERSMQAALEWNIRVQDEPLRDMNGMFRDIIYEECRDKDCRILFSGFGGQEMVSSGVNITLDLLGNGQFRDFWNEVKQRSKIDGENAHVNAVKQSGLVMLQKLSVNPNLISNQARTRYRNQIKRLSIRPIQPQFAKRIDIQERLRKYIHAFTFKGNVRQRQVQRFLTPNMPFRLETCDIATRSFHLEYRYPLLDLELLEFYLALPPLLKSRNGYGRYLIRKAHEAVTPSELWWGHMGQHGASNPQVLGSTGLDELATRFEEIPKDNPYHLYADYTKVNQTRSLNFRRDKEFHLYQITPLINHLIFAEKLGGLKK